MMPSLAASHAVPGGICLLLAVTMLAGLAPLRWPRLSPTMWLLGRAGHLGMVGLTAVGLADRWVGLLAVLVAAVVMAWPALVLSDRGEPAGPRWPDAAWWAGGAALTGWAVWLVCLSPLPRGWLPVVVVLVCGGSLVAELMAGRGKGRRRGRGALGAGELFTLTSLAGTTAAMVAGVPVIGWWFVPIALAPLLNIAGALQNRTRALAVAQETVTAISRLPDVAGYTRDEHGVRVADLSQRMAVAMGLPEGERNSLRQAALMHDVGLVSLNQRIKSGSTSLLAPLDQQRIAARSAEIAAELPAHPSVIKALHHQAHPYIDHVMYRADVPRVARILKVANAVDDYAEGVRTTDALTRALSRISMQQGYEFDPEVVEAAQRVVPRWVL